VLTGNAASTLAPTASAFVSAPPGVAPRTAPSPRAPPALPVPSPLPPTTTAPPTGDLAARRARAGIAPGALDPHSPLAKRAAELEGRHAYLKNFWYCVGISEEITTKPVGVQALGEKLVLFRGDDGAVKALSDVCPHRGAPLHKGWVAKVDGTSCVVCPYHGWALDGGGTLRDVPAAETEREWPRKRLVDSYPVRESGGFVWLFYGSPAVPDEERPPVPTVPELTAPGWKAVYGSIEFACDAWGVFENAIDMAHIHFLHGDTFGNQAKPEIRGMRVSTDAHGVTATFGLHNKPVNSLWAFSAVPEVGEGEGGWGKRPGVAARAPTTPPLPLAQVQVTAKALLPSTSVISFTLGGGLSFTTFVCTTPVAPGRSVNRFALVRRLAADPTGGAVFNARLWDPLARRAMLRILGEDRAMVEGLDPSALDAEVSVKADLPQTAFRKLRQEWLDLGYGVPPPGKEGCSSAKAAAAADDGAAPRDF